MLQDSAQAFGRMLDDYDALGIIGRVVLVDGKLIACTFGMPVNEETFCVLFEVADLSYKGVAAFIFRQLCEDVAPYRCINIMDDSGLESLRTVKESYRPLRRVSAYIATCA
jgi:hypothetical protein